jgi:hypothetical protein
MSRAGVPLLVWAAFLTVLTAVLWVWEGDNVPPAIFSAAAGIAWLAGLYALVGGRSEARVRATPDLSLASVLVALSVAMLVVGALVGPWLVLVGAGALVIGLVGIARELTAQRRMR